MGSLTDYGKRQTELKLFYRMIRKKIRSVRRE